MASMVAIERHICLNLSDKAFLLDALMSLPGLFGNAVASVESFQEAKKQFAVFQRFATHHHKSHGAAARGQPQPFMSGLMQTFCGLNPTVVAGETLHPW